MKKSSTFNLEQDTFEEIESYRVTYNLSSRNIALERMLLERRELIDIKEVLLGKRDELRQNTAAKEPEYKPKEKSNSILDNSLKDSFNNMPD